MTVPEPDTHDPLRNKGGHYEFCPVWTERDCEFEDGQCLCDKADPVIAAVRAEQRGVGEPLDAEAKANLAVSEFGNGYGSMVADKFLYHGGLIAVSRKSLTEFALSLIRSAPLEPLTLEELEALPVGSVVLDTDGFAWQRERRGRWLNQGFYRTSPELLSHDGPVRLLHRGVN